MIGPHFRLRSEFSGAIAKRLPNAKNQLYVPCSFFNQFVTDLYIQPNLSYADTNQKVPITRNLSGCQNYYY